MTSTQTRLWHSAQLYRCPCCLCCQLTRLTPLPRDMRSRALPSDPGLQAGILTGQDFALMAGGEGFKDMVHTALLNPIAKLSGGSNLRSSFRCFWM